MTSIYKRDNYFSYCAHCQAEISGTPFMTVSSRERYCSKACAIRSGRMEKPPARFMPISRGYGAQNRRRAQS